MASSSDPWIKEYNEASRLADDISSMIADRGSLPQSGPEIMRHTSAIRRKITILGTRLDSLEALLSRIPPKTIIDKELHKRQDMLSNLKSKAKQMATSFNMSNFANREDLLGQSKKAADDMNRVAGLDNQGIVSLQRQVMKEQDEGLEKLEETVLSTKHIALAVNEELTLHTGLIDDLENHVDVTNSRLQMAERPSAISHGVFVGHWAEILWNMMQHLKYKKRPTYQGYRYKVGEHPLWRVEVLLYSNLAPDTTFHIFDAPIRRDTFADGIQDAAREAVRHLRYTYDRHLQSTGFHYYPMHIPFRLDSTFCSVGEKDSPELTHQVDLLKALDYAYGKTLEELRTAQENLEAAEEKLKLVETKLASYKVGEASSSELEHTPSTL